MRTFTCGLALAITGVTQDGYFIDDISKVECPLEVVDGGDGGVAVYVQIAIGEHTGRFLIDTGAAMAISVDFAKKINLARKTKVFALGITAVDSIYTYRVPELRVGKFVLENHLMMGMEMSDDFDQIDGIIGYDALQFCVLELDPVHDRCVFHNPDDWKPRADDIKLPLKGQTTGANCRIDLGLSRSQLFVFDTGNQGMVMLHLPFIRKHRVLEAKKNYLEMETHGVFGSTKTYLARLSEFRFGSLRFVDFPVDLASDDATGGSIANGVTAGNLGFGILTSLVTIVDGRRSALFVRTIGKSKTVAYRDTFGLCLVSATKGPKVDYVYPTSPAHNRVAIDDTVLLVNGKDAPTNATGLVRTLRTLDKATLTLARAGEVHTVTLTRRQWLPSIELHEPASK